MKAKQLITLAGLLVVAVLIALAISGRGTKDKPDSDAIGIGDKPFAELPVNDVTLVKITDDENSVELERSGEKWVVKSRDGYAADFSKLVRSLRTLKELTVAETVKAGASAYGRLKIKDPGEGEDENAGTKVELKSSDGADLATMVLGMNYTGGRSGNETPRYMRLMSDDKQVFVVPATFADLRSDPAQWLVRDFFRIQKPKTVTVTQSDGAAFKFFREDEGGDLKLEGLAENEELNTSNTGTIGAPFSNASFKDVVVGDDARPEKTGLDKAAKVEVETFEGFRYLVNLGEGAGENADSDATSATLTSATYHMTVEVSAELPEKREPQADETVADDASDEDKKKAAELKQQRDSEFESKQKTLKEKLEQEKAYAGKVYLVDSWIAEKFFMRRDELVKEKEAPAEGEAAASAGAPAVSLTPGGGSKPKVVATTPAISVADVLEKSKATAPVKIAEDAKAAAEQATDAAKDATDEAKDAVEDAVEAAAGSAEGAVEAAKESAEEIKSVLEEAVDAAGDSE